MISIRRRLTRELLIAFLVLLGGALAALYFAARDELVEQFDDALRAKTLAISSLTQDDGEKIQVDTTDRLFRSFGRDDHDDYFEIWNADGKPVARSESLKGENLLLPERLGHARNMTLPNGVRGRALSLKFTPNQETGEHADVSPTKTQLILVVASDRGGLVEALTELLGIGLGCSVLFLGAMLWLVPRVLLRGLQPLAQLGEQAAAIDADSLTTRFPVKELPAELQPIVSRLNELLARLEVSFERERRFSADLAHELRTPLAELRALAECAIKWPETREPGADADVLAIATQMQTIVTSLLALARAEQKQAVGKLEPVNLADLARDTWETYQPRAVERGLKVDWQMTPTTLPADPGLLRSVLGNLFENAVNYAPDGSEISIRLESGSIGPIFRIANAAGNLEAADVPKLFDRFWRKEESRTGGRHFGLGLSLARMFAQAMGWTLTAELDGQHRLEFVFAAANAR